LGKSPIGVKATSSKLQIRNKSQYQNSKQSFLNLVLVILNLFGACNFGFVILFFLFVDN